MKRITTAMLVTLLGVLLAACGGNDSGKDTDTEPNADTAIDVESDGETVIWDTVPESYPAAETDATAESATETDGETDAAVIQNIQPIYPERGATVRLLNEKVWNFCNGYTLQATNRLTSFSGGDDYYPETLTLSFACVQTVDYYRVAIARSADMADALVYLVGTPELTLENLFTGTQYFWRVDAVAEAENRTYRSAVYTFTTEEGPRAIRVDGVSNTRDIGGAAGLGGCRIKQGMIYRGGQLENITAEGRDVLLNVLRIKTDVDLRTPGTETSGKSPLGTGVGYFNFDGCYYVEPNGFGHGIDTAANMAIMAEELRVFTNPDNYPVYIHCSLGRDRTGTLVFLLQGLLGVDKDAMAMDYELSGLSMYGSMGDPDAEFFPRCFNCLYDYIDTRYRGATFAEKVEQYMLRIGLSAEEIQSIRTIMLEEVS